MYSSNHLLDLLLQDMCEDTTPLLQCDVSQLPHQAYCETVTSSRPASPDLVPEPLRIISNREHGYGSNILRIEVVGHKRESHEAAVDTEQVQCPPTRPGNGLTDALETAAITINCIPSNRTTPTGHKMSANSNHSAQAVTPRGSHSANQAVYHATPSPRMRLGLSVESPTWAIVRKPVRQQTQNADMALHPLPPLPAVDDQDSHARPHLRTSLDQGAKYSPREPFGVTQSLVWQHPYDRNDTSFSASHYVEANNPRARSLTLYNPITPTLNEPNATFDHGSDPSRPRKPRYSPVLRGTGLQRTPPSHGAHNRDTHVPSSDELYPPRGILSGVNQGWAYRRTAPKDAKLRYPFGRRPSAYLTQPPLTTRHHQTPRSPMKQSFDCITRPPSSQHPPTSQSGPRPPPWRSYDDLALRRLERGDARDRSRAQQLRSSSRVDSEALLGGEAGRVDGFGREGMRREVEENRGQILKLYPEMTFEVDEGGGGWRRDCCCGVM